MQGLVVTVIADPDLRLYEHVGSIEAGPPHSFADIALIVVRGRSVDMPVAGRQRGLDSRRRLLRRALENAQPQSRHRDAIVESDFHLI
jgi:hypothetical protein